MGDGSFFLEIGNERVELPDFWDFLLFFSGFGRHVSMVLMAYVVGLRYHAGAAGTWASRVGVIELDSRNWFHQEQWVDRCDRFSLYLVDTVVVWQTHRLKLAFLVQRYTLYYVPQELNSQVISCQLFLYSILLIFSVATWFVSRSSISIVMFWTGDSHMILGQFICCIDKRGDDDGMWVLNFSVTFQLSVCETWVLGLVGMTTIHDVLLLGWCRKGFI